MGNKKLLLIGGGGHCRSVLDCLLSDNPYQAIGIIDRNTQGPSGLLGIPVVGSDEDLPRLFSEGWTHAFITLGSIGTPVRRQALYTTLTELGFEFPTIVDPSAVIARAVTLGPGVFVGKRAVVNTGTQVGACAIVNTGAILEHDCTVGDFAHISPGCTLCGGVSVGEYTHVGAGCVVRQQIKIGANALIGAGSTVVQEIENNVEAYGVPCKVVKKL